SGGTVLKRPCRIERGTSIAQRADCTDLIFKRPYQGCNPKHSYCTARATMFSKDRAIRRSSAAPFSGSVTLLRKPSLLLYRSTSDRFARVLYRTKTSAFRVTT